MYQAFNNVETLLNELKPFLLMAGIPLRSCSMPTGDITQIRTAMYAHVFDWLDAIIKSPEFAEVLAARKLVPEEMWTNYSILDIRGLPEQKILKSKLIDLKRLWSTNKPPFFGRHYDSQQNIYQ